MIFVWIWRFNISPLEFSCSRRPIPPLINVGAANLMWKNPPQIREGKVRKLERDGQPLLISNPSFIEGHISATNWWLVGDFWQLVAKFSIAICYFSYNALNFPLLLFFSFWVGAWDILTDYANLKPSWG